MMKRQNIDRLNYRFSFVSLITQLLLSNLLLMLSYLMITSKEYFAAIFTFIVFLCVVYALIMQQIAIRKPYRLFVESKVLRIDPLFSVNKAIPFSEIKGLAVHQQTIKFTTAHYLQFATSPQVWCDYYQKKHKLEQYSNDFQEMYIVVSITNQKDSDVHQFANNFFDANIPKRGFVFTILGKYPGKPKNNKKSMNNAVIRKQRFKQWISCFAISTVLIYTVVSWIWNICGIYFGIFW